MRDVNKIHGTALNDLFAHLEPRQLLTLTSPFPELSDLDNPYNAVVRVTTNYGDIDIEIYDNLAGGTFIDEVNNGGYDMFFFHRLVDGFVLQGGGFRFTDDDGLSPLRRRPYSHSPGASRPALTERAVAIADLVDTGEGNQFFFNLADNTDAFNVTPDSGPLVFGRVVNDASWSVVQTIANLPIVDMSGNPAFAGDSSDEFTAVPGGPNPSETTLATAIDVEVIKDQFQDFFRERVFYPEGFAGGTINEFLPIGNPHDDNVRYQVIVRSEFPVGDASEGYTFFRDRVVSMWTIGSLRREGITLSRFGEGGAPSRDDRVPQGVPYSIEVRSTRPLMVNFSHYDFGTSTGESLVGEVAQRWTFAQGKRDTDTGRSFLVWYNTGAEKANIDITFILDDGSTRTTSVQTDAYRRGGLNINDLDMIPDGAAFSIIVESDVDINAAFTRYDTSGDGTGSTELGIAGEGSTRGVVPMGNAGATAEQYISFVNTSDTDIAVITLIFSFSGGSPERAFSPAALNLAPGRRADFRVNDIPELNDGRRFTMRYDSGDVPVFAHTRNVQFTDEVAYPVGVNAATSWLYGEGFFDPARAGTDVFETLSVFNPNFVAMGLADVTATVKLQLFYVDSVIELPYAITPGGRVDINIHELAAVIAQANNNGLYYYSIAVLSSAPVVSQFWHHDLSLGGLQASGGFGELGTPRGDIARLG